MHIEIMQQKLAKLEDKLASLTKPSFVDDEFMGQYFLESQGCDDATCIAIDKRLRDEFTEALNIYHRDLHALTVAISHFQKMIDIDYVLSLID